MAQHGMEHNEVRDELARNELGQHIQALEHVLVLGHGLEQLNEHV